MRLPPVPAQPLCVGFSAGLDSTVLLHALHAIRPDLTAVHVHHGLSPNADAWAEAARAFCAARGIPLAIERVSVDRDARDGLEAAARAARYAVYAARPGAVVALAHHRDDQAETVLLQLLRGTGLKGVAAMPALRALTPKVSLWRPLLEIPRAEILAYAREHHLTWVEDESNSGTKHDRNYLRHEVGPRIEARFPRWREALARFAGHAAEAESLLAELAALDGAPAEADISLPLDASLAPARRANVLRAWLAAQGLPMPSGSRLDEIARQAFDAKPDARVRIEHGGAWLVRHRDALHAESPQEPATWMQPWRGEPRLDLGALGEVTFERVTGEGIDAARAVGEGWRLGHRAGGERLRIAAGRPERTLKNLLQEHRVPWWERGRMPLLFHGDNLVWAPGVGIAAGYACPGGAEGLRPAWRVAGKAPLC